METGLSDVQTIGLLHALQREAPRCNFAPTPDEYEAFLQRHIARIRDPEQTPGLTQARRASIVRRLQDTLNGGTLPTTQQWWGQTGIRERALLAADAQERFFAEVGRRTQRSEAYVRARYAHYLREGIPEDVSQRDIAAPVGIDDFPVDRHSRWAARAVRAECGDMTPIGPLQCAACGRFRGDDHQCQQSATTSHSEATEGLVATTGATTTTTRGTCSLAVGSAGWAAIHRCMVCGQFTGYGTHRCVTRIAHIDPNSIEEPATGNRLPNRITAHQYLITGRSIRFAGMSSSPQAGPEARRIFAGINPNGDLDVWTSDPFLMSELESISNYLHEGWDVSEGQRVLREQRESDERMQALSDASEARWNAEVDPPSDDAFVPGPTLATQAEDTGVQDRIAVRERDRAPTNIQFSENMPAFQQVYDRAKALKEQGAAQFVPYMRENATNGLGDKETGRGFGIEIEYTLADGRARYAVADAIGAALESRGILNDSYQHGYHESSSSLTTEELANYWRFEEDMTVAGELISPILHDTPKTWRDLETVCAVIREHGGKASVKTGNHVHVGIGDYGVQTEQYRNLLTLLKEHEDIIYRLAQNPRARAHRGTHWCSPNWPIDGYSSVSTFENYRIRLSSHNYGINLGGVTGGSSGHAEFRMWDGSLDPGVIQAQVNVSLALTQAGASGIHGTGANPIGTQRERGRQTLRESGATRLSGQDWEASTRGFRQFMDAILSSTQNKEQIIALFATTKWQSAGS